MSKNSRIRKNTEGGWVSGWGRKKNRMNVEDISLPSWFAKNRVLLQQLLYWESFIRSHEEYKSSVMDGSK